MKVGNSVFFWDKPVALGFGIIGSDIKMVRRSSTAFLCLSTIDSFD